MMRVERGRLARAVHLEVEALGARQWAVTGGRERHLVTTEGCDCVDSGVHLGIVCKHQLAIGLVCLPVEVLNALRALVPVQRARTRRTRKTEGRPNFSDRPSPSQAPPA